jgi:hypothetical protein
MPPKTDKPKRKEAAAGDDENDKKCVEGNKKQKKQKKQRKESVTTDENKKKPGRPNGSDPSKFLVDESEDVSVPSKSSENDDDDDVDRPIHTKYCSNCEEETVGYGSKCHECSYWFCIDCTRSGGGGSWGFFDNCQAHRYDIELTTAEHVLHQAVQKKEEEKKKKKKEKKHEKKKEITKTETKTTLKKIEMNCMYCGDDVNEEKPTATFCIECQSFSCFLCTKHGPFFDNAVYTKCRYHHTDQTTTKNFRKITSDGGGGGSSNSSSSSISKAKEDSEDDDHDNKEHPDGLTVFPSGGDSNTSISTTDLERKLFVFSLSLSLSLSPPPPPSSLLFVFFCVYLIVWPMLDGDELANRALTLLSAMGVLKSNVVTVPTRHALALALVQDKWTFGC